MRYLNRTYRVLPTALVGTSVNLKSVLDYYFGVCAGHAIRETTPIGARRPRPSAFAREDFLRRGWEWHRETLFLTLRAAPLAADKVTRPKIRLGQIPNRGIASCVLS